MMIGLPAMVILLPVGIVIAPLVPVAQGLAAVFNILGGA